MVRNTKDGELVNGSGDDEDNHGTRHDLENNDNGKHGSEEDDEALRNVVVEISNDDDEGFAYFQSR